MSSNDPLVSIPLRELDQPPHVQESPTNNGCTIPVTHLTHSQPPLPQSSPSNRSTSRSRKHQRHQDGRDWWIWELIGLATSGLSLGAMIGVLVYYNGKVDPSKNAYGITLNSILSWTATIAKSAMLIPISDGLSQMKWIWFSERDRELADMDYFDDASRGPWGSMRLLFRLRFRHLGALGAVLTLLSLAYDPVVQLMVRYPIRITLLPNTAAIVSAIDQYGDFESGLNSDAAAAFPVAPLPIKGAIYSGFFSQHPPIRPYFECPSDRCNWTTYDSVAICSNCHNVSTSLQVDCKGDSCDAKLPSGASLSGSQDVLMSTATSTKPVYYKNASSTAHVLGVFQNIAAFGQPRVRAASDLEASECILYLCVKEYHSVVTAGRYYEKVLNTWPDLNSTTDQTTPKKDNQGCFYTVAGRRFGMANNVFEDIKEYLSFILNGTVKRSTGLEIKFLNSDLLQPIWLGRSFDQPISRTALTMTKAVRDNNTGDTRDDPPSGHPGDAGEFEKYVEVQWIWLVLPIALFLATAFQLALTILRTRRTGAGIWRSSALALAFHGLDRDTDELATARLKGAQPARENEDTLLKAAKGLLVRMTHLDDGTTKLIVSHDSSQALLADQGQEAS